MKLLALDVGDRRVGVAVSDASGLIATPLTVIVRRSKVEDFARIGRLVREQEAKGLVVGLPLNDDGSLNPQAQRIARYAAALKTALQAEGLELPLVLWDERMSTRRAEEALLEGGRKARVRRKRMDAAAAAVILQDYLDEQRSRSDSSVGLTVDGFDPSCRKITDSEEVL